MRLALVLESNTDRRRVEGLAALTELTVVSRGARIAEFAPRPEARFRVVAGPASRVRFAPFVAAHLLRSSYDAVLVDNYFVAALGANLAACVTRTPTAMHVRNPMEDYYRCRRGSPVAGKPFRAAELAALWLVARLNARVGQRYLCVSSHLAEVVRRHGGSLPASVVPSYGVDLSVFRPAPVSRAALRRELGLPVDAEIVLSASRVAPEKDPDTVLRALRVLRGAGRDVRLLTAAHGGEWLSRRAQELGVGDLVIAHPMVDPGDELARRYRAADVVVQSSRAEGFGLVPVEALACGTPVIASAVGGLRETVRDGETGWTFPVGDERALARAIVAALDDPAEAARRTAAGARLVRERYASADAFARILASLTPGTSPTRTAEASRAEPSTTTVERSALDVEVEGAAVERTGVAVGV